MVVSDGQKLGALALLILSLFYYGFSQFALRQPVLESPIPWGHQGAESMAIEIQGGRAEGIYFFPQGTGFDQITKWVGMKAVDEHLRGPDGGISEGTVLMISPEGIVSIGEMAAARRLALGLRIDLNRASEVDLSRVPGIGDRMAAQIVQLRLERGKFNELSDLAAVPGIKEKKLKILKNYLMVQARGGVMR